MLLSDDAVALLQQTSRGIPPDDQGREGACGAQWTDA
jgi:hypothetical protein